MDNELLFSIIDFKMYVNDDENNKWFDVDKIKKINVVAQLVPLFNTNTNLERDFFDDLVFVEPMIVVSLFQRDRLRKSVNELISYEYLLSPSFDKENIYQIDLEIDFNDIKDKLNRNSIYEIAISYYIEEYQHKNLFVQILANQFGSMVIPFIKNGGWLNGRK